MEVFLWPGYQNTYQSTDSTREPVPLFFQVILYTDEFIIFLFVKTLSIHTVESFHFTVANFCGLWVFCFFVGILFRRCFCFQFQSRNDFIDFSFVQNIKGKINRKSLSRRIDEEFSGQIRPFKEKYQIHFHHF